jgi:LPS-assembly lipoprotein
MSLPEPRSRSFRLLPGLAVIVVALLAGSGCTVRPLYSDAATSLGGATGSTAGLGAIAIAPVNTRYGQELRNHLIFLLNGGQGQPAAAAFTMDLTVTAANFRAAVIQVNKEDRPTAGAVEMTASYVIKEVATGEVVAKGRRQVRSSYDRSSQEFAAMRTIRDAENRAARELAEFLRLDIGQKLATR